MGSPVKPEMVQPKELASKKVAKPTLREQMWGQYAQGSGREQGRSRKTRCFYLGLEAGQLAGTVNTG